MLLKEQSMFKFTGPQSPPRRLLIQPSATSPFCTCPSQLQEATLDPDVTGFSYVGLRSPGAVTCGRSVKEFEEQLTSLRKENFDLKLRIYFLEERLGSNFNTDKENAIKKNIELMVELENTRKELEDKQELLCQAAKAMEIEDTEKQKEFDVKDAKIAELTKQLKVVRDELEDVHAELQIQEENNQLALCKEAFNLSMSDTTSIVAQLQETIKDLQNKLSTEKERSDHLQKVMEIAEFEHKRCRDLKNELHDKEQEITSLISKMEESNQGTYENNERVRQLELELKRKDMDLETQKQLVDASSKDVEVKERQLKEMSALIEEYHMRTSQDEKRTEKYKTSALRRSSKIVELESYIESQQHKIQTLETRLSAALAEVTHKSETCQTVSCGPEAVRATPTDSPLFSVRNPASVSTELPDTETATVSSAASGRGSAPAHRPAASSCHLATGDDGDDADELRHAREEIVRLKAEQHKACQIIHSMIAARKSDTQQIQTLKKRLTAANDSNEPKDGSAISNSGDVGAEQSGYQEESQLVDQYKILTNELENKIEVLTEMLTEKDNQIQHLEERHTEVMKELETQANRIVDLEFELLSTSSLSLRAADAGNADKEVQIKQLEHELQKRTCDLQSIVNKELWEKNRAIEKMQRVVEGRDQQIAVLAKDLDGKELQLQVLKEKINELVIPNADLGKSCERCSELRQISEILSARLEELSIFLNSLLRQKVVLGLLNNDQAKRVQDIVDKSINLSHTLTTIVSLNDENSLVQLSNLTNLLDATRNETLNVKELFTLDEDQSVFSIVASDITLTYQSHLNITPDPSVAKNADEKDVVERQAHVITILRTQIANLKREIQVRDNELCKITGREAGARKSLDSDADFVDAVIWMNDMECVRASTSATKEVTQSMSRLAIANQSDSESWSEPDRTVSLARIGLDDETVRPMKRNSKVSAKSTGSSETTEQENSRRTPSKKLARQTIVSLHEQLAELEAKLKCREQELATQQIAYSEMDNRLKEELRNNVDLQQKIEEYVERVARAEVQLHEMEVMAERSRETVVILEQSKREMEVSAAIKDKEWQNKLNELQVAKDRAIEAVHRADDSLKITTEEKVRLEEELKKMFMLKKDLENQFALEVQTIEHRCEQQCKEYRGQIEHMRELYERDYVQKVQVAEQMRELEHITAHVEVLKTAITDGEQQIRALQVNEAQLHSQIESLQRENSKTTNALHRELDCANLRYSEVTLEKTKLINENAKMDHQIRRNQLREADLMKQVSAFKEEFEDLKSNFQKHYAFQEEHKSKLQTRVSELETSNNELSNHLRSELCHKNMKKMAEKNTDLRKRLSRTQRALEETVNHLKVTNQRKREVEKTICKQIHKTSQVLRKAKANLGSSSDSDMLK